MEIIVYLIILIIGWRIIHYLYWNFGKEALYVKNLEQEYKMFNKNESDAWGAKHYGRWGSNLKNAFGGELRAWEHKDNVFIHYCGMTGYAVNDEMIHETGNDYLQNIINKLKQYILDAPRLNENVILFRLEEDEFIDYIVQNHKSNKNTIYFPFLSTTMEVDTLFDPRVKSELYGKRKKLLRLFVEKGTPGVYVNAIDRRYEKEFLFYPGGELILLRKPYFDSKYGMEVCDCIYKVNIDE